MYLVCNLFGVCAMRARWQAALDALEPEVMGFVFTAVTQNLLAVATHRFGCCVLQRCLNSEDPTRQELLLSAMIAIILQIVPDAYGNYAVQHVIAREDSLTNTRLFGAMAGHFLEFACNKHASCVIEVSRALAVHIRIQLICCV